MWRRRSVVWLPGVRRAGKTTLCRSLPDIEYFDCELPRQRRAMEDPEAFLESLAGKRVVLDARRIAPRHADDSEKPGRDLEAALRHLIEGLQSGNPDDAAMSPGLAQATRQQLPALHEGLSRAGAVQSIQFLGVAPNGADTYDVRQQNGVSHWLISLDAGGKVAGAFVTPGP